ncbi:serine/threonine protein kinase [Streptomyces sp. NBC_00638]|uniref:serine/threonine-protein kinase n=1 Tax=unclassified Streptomyces TaxID=2593676 RepID=UPI002251F851|nr:serine/threonine-protein kinase [Streptomyces sp. NBC_00638]MCX5001143.1 serine/threonine protein kinase [Streptomyces sp. NBC_00638]
MDRIGPYTVERVLGAGGMGVVYQARSRGGRLVAVKVARPELAQDSMFRERFRAEVNAARRVGAFHTAPVVDADPDAELPWLATAYIAGPTLADALDAQGPMNEQALRALGAALAEALQAIHACGLVHRDLKPGNIIMAVDGPRVVDFGIARAAEDARLTVPGASVGTPGFLAPEQAEGHPVNGAADVFALGSVLVAAAGGSAFGHGTSMALMYRSVHHEADLTAVPVALRPVVEACLAKQPTLRPTPEHLLDVFTASPAPTAGYTPTILSAPSIPAPPLYPPTVTAPSAPAPDEDPAQAAEFLAMDHKNAVIADVHGISLGVNGRPVDFPWPIVHTVTHRETGRGYGLTVTVTLTDGQSHRCRVTTKDEDQLDTWIEELDEVIARYRPAG